MLAVHRRVFRYLRAAVFVTVSGALACSVAAAESLSPIRLPAPQLMGGKPLMQALQQRHTSRDFRRDPLPPQVFSNLLWAAFGINRPGSGGRTAPSAHDAQEIGIYVVRADGAYLYEPKGNALQPVRAGDLRALTGLQPFVKEAPVSLVYVADFTKFTRDSEADKLFYAAADAGHISQNVYLWSASEGMAVMVRAYIDKPALAKALRLKPSQHIILAQSVGYPQ
ncbi:MAG TPA: SagB/ThcOx family dehydrogenase [Burkholderiaceae bacterium]|nr:SagB/ThcOx family dehydrogenase [Burkholderiaceae bacterium]